MVWSLVQSSRPRLRVLILVLFAGAALAGCVSLEPELQAPEDDTRTVTNARDYSYLDNPNNTTGAHIHDYWGGLESMPILDATTSAGTTWNGPSHSVADFKPGDDVVVPLGTARVIITLSWTDSSGDSYGPPELWIRTNNMTTEELVTEIEQGVPIVFNTTNDDNDLPHQLLSAWEFHFYLKKNANGDTIQYDGDVTIEAWAERGLPIPLFSAHPDQWLGRTEIPLFEDTVDTLVYSGDSETNQMCIGGCPGTHDALPDAVVPLDADYVEVAVTYAPGTVNRIDFAYHPASTREWTLLPNPTVPSIGTDTWRIDMDGLMGDGPYAKQSLWKIKVSVPAPANGIDGFGPPFSGAYTITATVYK